MIEKIATTLEMSFKIPDSEKKIADQAMKYFFSVINSISIIKDYLDKVYDPLKAAASISPEALIKFRGKLTLIKYQIKKIFKVLKKNAGHALKYLNHFSTDTHCIELINAFKESMNDVSEACSKLINTLDDYIVSDFKDKMVAAIDNVRKEINQTEDLCRNRIINHLKNNIVGNGWEAEEYKKEIIEEKLPTVIKIYRDINNNKDIETNEMPQIEKRPQKLNFSDSQRVFLQE